MALKLIFNGITGQFDWIDQFTGASSDGYQVDKFTLTGTDITNKSVTIANAPALASDSRCVVIGGIEQDYGSDFIISGTTVSWNSLGMETLLEAGDRLIVVYKT